MSMKPAAQVKRRANFILRCARLPHDAPRTRRRFFYAFRVSRHSRAIASPLSTMSAVIGYRR